MAEDTALVVVHVAVAAADAFDLFDDPVEAFGAGVVDVVAQGGEDGGPPGLNGAGEAGRFGQLGVDGGFVKVGQPPPDPARLGFGEEEPEAFLDRPGGLDLLGRVAGVEGAPQPVPLFDR